MTKKRFFTEKVKAAYDLKEATGNHPMFVAEYEAAMANLVNESERERKEKERSSREATRR